MIYIYKLKHKDTGVKQSALYNTNTHELYIDDVLIEKDVNPRTLMSNYLSIIMNYHVLEVEEEG